MDRRPSVAVRSWPWPWPSACRARRRRPANAPGAPGTTHTWNPGDKDGFGSSRTTASKVWYTLNDGVLSEIFHPQIDTPSTRDTQLVVTDGETFVEREDAGTTHRVELVDTKALVYRQVNTSKSGRYRITKTYVTVPRRSAVLVDVVVASLTGRAYEVYVLHDPALSNTGDDDTGTSQGGALLAGDGRAAAALVTSQNLSATSSGYLDRSDGWTDLRNDFTMDWTYDATTPGNVVQLGRTRLTGLAGGQRMTRPSASGRAGPRRSRSPGTR